VRYDPDHIRTGEDEMHSRDALLLLLIVAGFAHCEPLDTDPPATKTVDSNEPTNSCAHGCDSRADGYAWAEKQDIDDADDCVGRSPAFVDGCRSYVEENHPSIYNGDGRF
jgi:hypothetical protein